MLRFKARVTVHKKNEDTNLREIEFDYTPELAVAIKNHIEFELHGVHFVDDDGNVFVLSVNNIEVLL